MKAIAYAAVLLGLVSTALGQAETTASLEPSPTESYGCEPHGDHWHCEGARTATVTGGATDAATTGAAATTSAAHDHDHDEDDHDHDEDEGEDHTDAAGTGALAPSPTESYGCEPHGDHWHCEGPITASTTAPPAGTGAGQDAAATTTSTSTAGALHFEVAGLGFAGIAAIAAMAL